MLLFPYGHDQSVYGRQWATWALIALNTAIFAWSAIAGASARDDVSRAVIDFELEQMAHPGAHLDPSIYRRFPELALIAGSAMEHTEDEALNAHDLELELAAQRAVTALRKMPLQRFGYQPAAPSPLTAVTSMFMHADFWHLFGNMLFLWLAGTVIECFWDRARFLTLYLLAGFAALLAHHLINPASFAPLVGASGAVSGLLGAFLIGYPRTRIRMLYAVPLFGVGRFEVRAWLLIPAWFVVQLLFAIFDGGGFVAHAAHVGGFVLGVVGALIMARLGWVIEDAGNGTRSA